MPPLFFQFVEALKKGDGVDKDVENAAPVMREEDIIMCRLFSLLFASFRSMRKEM